MRQRLSSLGNASPRGTAQPHMVSLPPLAKSDPLLHRQVLHSCVRGVLHQVRLALLPVRGKITSWRSTHSSCYLAASPLSASPKQRELHWRFSLVKFQAMQVLPMKILQVILRTMVLRKKLRRHDITNGHEDTNTCYRKRIAFWEWELNYLGWK